MQVDESGRDDVAVGVERLCSLKFFIRDRRDATTLDANIPNRVETGLWINATPAVDYQVDKAPVRFQVTWQRPLWQPKRKPPKEPKPPQSRRPLA